MCVILKKYKRMTYQKQLNEAKQTGSDSSSVKRRKQNIYSNVLTLMYL